jgi:hypothetical protein
LFKPQRQKPPGGGETERAGCILHVSIRQHTSAYVMCGLSRATPSVGGGDRARLVYVYININKFPGGTKAQAPPSTVTLERNVTLERALLTLRKELKPCSSLKDRSLLEEARQSGRAASLEEATERVSYTYILR